MNRKLKNFIVNLELEEELKAKVGKWLKDFFAVLTDTWLEFIIVDPILVFAVPFLFHYHPTKLVLWFYNIGSVVTLLFVYWKYLAPPTTLKKKVTEPRL